MTIPADRDLATWCQPCCYGQHADCYDIRQGTRFQNTSKLPEAERRCLCRHKRNHVEPPEIAGTCRVSVTGADAWGGGHPCGKPAKGTVSITRTWGDKSGLTWDDPRRLVEVRACGVHLAAARRRAENDAKRAAAGAAAQAEEAERRRRRQVATDHTERLQALGFAAVVGWDGTGRYDVLLNGEVAVALVEQYQLLCRELGLDFAAEVEALTHGGRT